MRRLCVLILALMVSVALMFKLATQTVFRSADQRSPGQDEIVLSATPRRLGCTIEPYFAADSVEATVVARHRQLRLVDELALGYCCHLLRMEGAHVQLPTPRDVVQALTEDERGRGLFGRTVLLKSRAGLRYSMDNGNPLGTNGESHRDLCLAAFAEHGLPLSTEMVVGGRTYALEDVLRDSMNECTLSQSELEWTAVAYALYMESGGWWRNKDGERVCLDEIALELVRRDRRRGSCGGTHILYALTLLMRTGRLTGETQNRVVETIRAAVAQAEAAQDPAGCWGVVTAGGGQGSARDKLLMTGHTLEWLERVPADMQPGSRVYQSASAWLCRELLSALGRPDALAPGHEICPRAHAVCALRALVKP